METDSTQGGFDAPSEDEELGRMIRSTVESWSPRRGPDWPGVLIRIAGTAPPAWLVYSAASAVLVVILITAFLVGSAMHLGALGPQQVQLPGH